MPLTFPQQRDPGKSAGGRDEIWFGGRVPESPAAAGKSPAWGGTAPVHRWSAGNSGQVRAVPQECDFGLYCPFRIKEEWNFVAECRRKGIPQAAYCKNGFVDTSVRLLEKIERNTFARQSSLSKERDKRKSPFVFELSGEQWTVSAARGCPMRCWILLEALTGLGLGRKRTFPWMGRSPLPSLNRILRSLPPCKTLQSWGGQRGPSEVGRRWGPGGPPQDGTAFKMTTPAVSPPDL